MTKSSKILSILIPCLLTAVVAIIATWFFTKNAGADSVQDKTEHISISGTFADISGSYEDLQGSYDALPRCEISITADVSTTYEDSRAIQSVKGKLTVDGKEYDISGITDNGELGISLYDMADFKSLPLKYTINLKDAAADKALVIVHSDSENGNSMWVGPANNAEEFKDSLEKLGRS